MLAADISSYELLKKVVNEVEGINRVVYDITGKPPRRLSGSNDLGFLGKC